MLRPSSSDVRLKGGEVHNRLDVAKPGRLAIPSDSLAESPSQPGVIAQIWREHRLWVVIAGAHLGVGALLDWLGILDIIRPGGLWDPRILLQFLLLTMLWLPVQLARFRWQVREHGQRVNGWRGWQIGLARFRAVHRPAVVLGVFTAAFLTMITIRLHDSWKSTISGYDWDRTFHGWDLVLHGGLEPWRWVHPLVGFPAATQIIDQTYFAWYYVVTVCLVWQAWNTHRPARTRFFVAYALTIVLLGTAMAHVFASGGPVFYAGLVAGPDPYAPLVAYLEQVHAHEPLRAVQLQRLVWANHVTGAREFWLSMSAMPSLHVGLAVIFACAGWDQSRRLGLLLTGFAAMTLLGSVSLGWHYAVDGYVAVAGAVACWWVADRCTQGTHDRASLWSSVSSKGSTPRRPPQGLRHSR